MIGQFGTDISGRRNSEFSKMDNRPKQPPAREGKQHQTKTTHFGST